MSKIGGFRINFCGKHGWPIEKVKGKYISNFIRICLHTRKIRFGDLPNVNYSKCP